MRRARPACVNPSRRRTARSLVVIGWDGWQRSRADCLPAESAVVRVHELLGGGARGQSSGSTKHGQHGEVRRESSCSDGGPQRADVDVEFLGQLVERQPLVLSLMMGDRVAGTLQHRNGHHASSAIPWPEGLERHRQQRGELALSQADPSTQLAQLVHCCAHDAIRGGDRKATTGLDAR